MYKPVPPDRSFVFSEGRVTSVPSASPGAPSLALSGHGDSGVSGRQSSVFSWTKAQQSKAPVNVHVIYVTYSAL